MIPGVFAINPISLDPGNDRSLTVRAIAKDINGKYWIGTRGGLYIFEKTKGVTAFYHHDEREPQSLVNNSVQCIFHDKKGDVWIGTRNGINFLIEERQHIRSYKSMPGDNRFLNSGEIYAFWMDPDQNLWIGTENGGINILNRKTGRFRYLVPQKGNPNSLSVNCIKAFESDGKGNLWIGTFLGGVDVLNIRTQQFQHYKHHPGDPASLSDNRVWALLRDDKNNMWVGTGSGLDRFDPMTGKFLHFPHITMGQQVNWLAQDSSGTIWIGADDLILFEPGSEKVIRIPEETRYMLHDSQNRFWLATLNNGIALFSKEKGIIKYYNEKSGLANNQALAILEDNEGFLWISTTNGLSKFNAQSERFHNYYTKNGFLNNQFTYGASCKLTKWRIDFWRSFLVLIFSILRELNQQIIFLPLCLLILKC
ncbi:MAG: hypothetical protein HC830_01170 [Bacteroidetes bacterium]|nr:hypothetical protein [Bacteroidota bacterium]